MSLFKKAAGLFGGGGANPEKARKKAFLREQERLKKKEAEARQEAKFLRTEGKGVARQATVQFGDELDLEDLTDEERLARSQGIKQDTGLVL